LVAWIERGKTPVIGVNSFHTKPEFRRDFGDGSMAFSAHAEMSAVSKLKLIKPNDVLYVMRFLKSGQPTMAKPCKYCQKYLRDKGIRKVRYTDWDGNWIKMSLV